MTGAELKKIMKRNGVTQRSVAAHAGITEQTIYERLKAKEVSTSTMQMVAETIGITLSDLVTMGDDAAWTKIMSEQQSLSELRRENEYLKALLAEKERTIQLLLGQKVENPYKENTLKG